MDMERNKANHFASPPDQPSNGSPGMDALLPIHKQRDQQQVFGIVPNKHTPSNQPGVWNNGYFDAKHIKDQSSQKAQSNDLKEASRKHLATCVEMVSKYDTLKSINHDNDEDLSSSHECEVNKSIKQKLEDDTDGDIVADLNNINRSFDEDEDPEMGFEVVNDKQHELSRLQISRNSIPIRRMDVHLCNNSKCKKQDHLKALLVRKLLAIKKPPHVYIRQCFFSNAMHSIQFQRNVGMELKPLLQPYRHKGREEERKWVQMHYQFKNLEKMPLSSLQYLRTPCMEWRTSYSTKPLRKNYRKEFSSVCNRQDIPYTTYGGAGKTSGRVHSSASSSSTHNTPSHSISHTSNTNSKSQARKSSSGSSGEGDGDDPRRPTGKKPLPSHYTEQLSQTGPNQRSKQKQCSEQKSHLTVQDGNSKEQPTPTAPSKEAEVQYEEQNGKSTEVVGNFSGEGAELSTLSPSEDLCAHCGELESSEVQEHSESISDTSASSTPSHSAYSCDVKQKDNTGSCAKKGDRMSMQEISTIPALPKAFNEAVYSSVGHLGSTKPKKKRRKCQRNRQKKTKSATPCQYDCTPGSICKARSKGKVKQRCSQISLGQQNVYTIASHRPVKEGSGELDEEKGNSAEIHQQSLATHYNAQSCEKEKSSTENVTLLDRQSELHQKMYQSFSTGESKTHRSNERPNDILLLLASQQRNEEKNERCSTSRPIIVHQNKRAAEHSSSPTLHPTHKEKQVFNGEEKMKDNPPKESLPTTRPEITDPALQLGDKCSKFRDKEECKQHSIAQSQAKELPEGLLWQSVPSTRPEITDPALQLKDKSSKFRDKECKNHSSAHKDKAKELSCDAQGLLLPFIEQAALKDQEVQIEMAEVSESKSVDEGSVSEQIQFSKEPKPLSASVIFDIQEDCPVDSQTEISLQLELQGSYSDMIVHTTDQIDPELPVTGTVQSDAEPGCRPTIEERQCTTPACITGNADDGTTSSSSNNDMQFNRQALSCIPSKMMNMQLKKPPQCKIKSNLCSFQPHMKTVTLNGSSDKSENYSPTITEPSVQSALQNFKSTSPNAQEQPQLSTLLEATEWTQGEVVVQPEAGGVPVEAPSTPLKAQVEESDTPVKYKHQTLEATELTGAPLDTTQVVNVDHISQRGQKRIRRLSRRERKRYSNSFNSRRNSSTESDRATCTKPRTLQPQPTRKLKRNGSQRKQRRKLRVCQQQGSTILGVSHQAVEHHLYHIPTDQTCVLVGSAGLLPTVDVMDPTTVPGSDAHHSELSSTLTMEKFPFSRCSPKAQERCVLGTFPPLRISNSSLGRCPHQEQYLEDGGVRSQHLPTSCRRVAVEQTWGSHSQRCVTVRRTLPRCYIQQFMDLRSQLPLLAHTDVRCSPRPRHHSHDTCAIDSCQAQLQVTSTQEATQTQENTPAGMLVLPKPQPGGITSAPLTGLCGSYMMLNCTGHHSTSYIPQALKDKVLRFISPIKIQAATCGKLTGYTLQRFACLCAQQCNLRRLVSLLQSLVLCQLAFFEEGLPLTIECSMIGIDVDPERVMLEYCSPATRSLETLCQALRGALLLFKSVIQETNSGKHEAAIQSHQVHAMINSIARVTHLQHLVALFKYPKHQV